MQYFKYYKLIRSIELSIGRILLIGSLAYSTSLTRVEAAALCASPCTLTWDQCQRNLVSGYAVYYGFKVSTATNRLNVGMTNRVTFKNLLAGSNYFFYVTSYNANNIESLPSDAIGYIPQIFSTMKLTALSNGVMSLFFQVATGAACHVEYTPTLKPAQWHTLSNVTADANGNVTLNDPLTGKPPARFYRQVRP